MSCKVKKSAINVPEREAQIEAAAFSRQMVCDNCQWNHNGYCKVVEAKNGLDNSKISDGVKRLGVRCPIGRWEAVTTVCVKCSRSSVCDDWSHQCKWCDLKDKTGRRHRVSYEPRNIERSLVKRPFNREPTRNLHYFIYPRFKKSTDYHIDRLTKLKPIFNGKTVCCVAVDSTTLHEQYKSQLEELFDLVYIIENDPKRRESAGFIPSLENLYTKDSNEMICFAHAKGQQVHTYESLNIKKWNDAMYETVVANWKEASEAMANGYPLAGSFKSIGNFATTPYRWHYSGSFWWGRSSFIFSNRSWKVMCDKWWASESYVGRHFASNEGYCLFGDNTVGGSMYKDETWNKVDLMLEDWRANHQSVIKPLYE